MSNINDSTIKLLELISKKIQLPLSLDYSLLQTETVCPKCKNGKIICIHTHTDGTAPTKGIPYDYDNFMHVCNNKDCDLVVTAALEDTPKNDKNLKRPNRCTLCGRSLDDKNRVFNNSNT